MPLSHASKAAYPKDSCLLSGECHALMMFVALQGLLTGCSEAAISASQDQGSPDTMVALTPCSILDCQLVHWASFMQVAKAEVVKNP